MELKIEQESQDNVRDRKSAETNNGTDSNKCSEAGNFRKHVQKPNKCNQCDYASSNAGHLRTHLKTHSGEKPNKCNQCDDASSDASTLRGHLKTHSGEKENKCNQCDYATSRASHLKTHLKTHS